MCKPEYDLTNFFKNVDERIKNLKFIKHGCNSMYYIYYKRIWKNNFILC